MDFQLYIPTPFQGVPEIGFIILGIVILLCTGLALFSAWIQSLIPNQIRHLIKIYFMVLILVFITIAIKKTGYITALF